MMNPRRTVPAGTAKSAKLWPRVVGLFALSFAAFFVLFVGYDLLTSLGQNALADAAISQQQQVIVIDPKISDELAKVLAQDQSPNLEDVRDPFTDRAGLTGTVSGTAVVQASASSSSGGNKPPTTTTVVGGNTGGTSGAVPAPPSAVLATRDRYNDWLARITAYGDMPLDPRIFAIEDLLPVGIVDGGNGNQEVLFYSEGACRTVSFAPGTSFFDGRLSELRPEGVVFSSFDGRQPIRMRSWTRSLQTCG